MSEKCLVFIDGCAANRFALINVDPCRALADGPFRLAVTPDLAREYRRALDHLFVPSYVKRLLAAMMDAAAIHDPPDPRAPTDRQLLALAETALVVTDDAELHRTAGAPPRGLVAWPDVEAHVKAGGALLDLFHARVGSDGCASGAA